MSSDRMLIVASFAFAVLWTAAMISWNSPGFAGAVILIIAGALCGIGWYAGMRLWMTWSGRSASLDGLLRPASSPTCGPAEVGGCSLAHRHCLHIATSASHGRPVCDCVSLQASQSVGR